MIHPSPGSGPIDRPSFTAVVGSIDSNAAKYVATMGVQAGRQEEINGDDLTAMCKVFTSTLMEALSLILIVQLANH